MTKEKLYNFNIKLNKELWDSSNTKTSLDYAREAFCERALTNALYFKCDQIIEISADGEFKFKCNDTVKHFKCNINDGNWCNDLIESEFSREDDAFVFGHGIVSEISRESFTELLIKLADMICTDSCFVFDYPNEKFYYDEMSEILSSCGFRIYENLNAKEAEEQLFDRYNIIYRRQKILPPKGINYCLAVRK